VQQAFDARSNSCHIHSYVHTLTHIQHFHSSAVLCQQPRETRTRTQAMKARQKCRLTGPTTGWRSNQVPCIEEKQRVRETNVRYTQKTKHTLTHFQHFHSSTVLCRKSRETHTLTQVMKDWQKCRVAGPTTGCFPN
jgi:hypothetical protein